MIISFFKVKFDGTKEDLIRYLFIAIITIEIFWIVMEIGVMLNYL